MYIEKRENKLKQEITLSIIGKFDKENLYMCEKQIKESINSREWERIIIDFNKTEDIDIDAIKLLWEIKDIANSKQKSLEVEKMNGKVAVALKFLGFSEKFNIDIITDEDIVSKVVMLGEYEEPLYVNKTISSDFCLKNKTILLESISNFLNETNKKFEIGIKEWVIIPDSLKNKLVILMETQTVFDAEKVENYLKSLMVNKHEVECSMYILEEGTFVEFYERKKQIGIPRNIISIPKVIRNPYTKQYFFAKIDERY